MKKIAPYFFVFAMLVCLVLAYITYQNRFECNYITAGQDDNYYPRIYMEKGYQTLSFQAKCYEIKEKAFKVEDQTFFRVYRGFYSDQDIKPLANKFEIKELGQLMYHDKYEMWDIFIYDNWYEGSEYWQILLSNDDGIQSYKVPKKDTFDSLICYSVNKNSVYLHILTNSNDLVICDLDLQSNSIENYTVSLQALGLTPNNFKCYYNNDTKSLVYINTQYGSSGIGDYNFALEQLNYTALEEPVSHLFLNEERYVAINNNSFGQLPIYFFSDTLKLENKISIPLSVGNTASGGSKFDNPFSAYMLNNKIYGVAILSQSRYLYYCADPYSEKLITKIELKTKGYALKDYKVYDKSNNCYPLGALQ